MAEAPDRYCGNCGHELSPEDKFCRSCGTPAHQAATVTTPEADAHSPNVAEIKFSSVRLQKILLSSLPAFRGPTYLTHSYYQ
jgi:uncharacterized OB-fold protein